MTGNGIGLDQVGLVPETNQQTHTRYDHQCMNISCCYQFESDNPFDRCHLCGYPTLGEPLNTNHHEVNAAAEQASAT